MYLRSTGSSVAGICLNSVALRASAQPAAAAIGAVILDVNASRAKTMSAQIRVVREQTEQSSPM